MNSRNYHIRYLQITLNEWRLWLLWFLSIQRLWPKRSAKPEPALLTEAELVIWMSNFSDSELKQLDEMAHNVYKAFYS